MWGNAFDDSGTQDSELHALQDTRLHSNLDQMDRRGRNCGNCFLKQRTLHHHPGLGHVSSSSAPPSRMRTAPFTLTTQNGEQYLRRVPKQSPPCRDALPFTICCSESCDGACQSRKRGTPGSSGRTAGPAQWRRPGCGRAHSPESAPAAARRSSAPLPAQHGTGGPCSAASWPRRRACRLQGQPSGSCEAAAWRKHPACATSACNVFP